MATTPNFEFAIPKAGSARPVPIDPSLALTNYKRLVDRAVEVFGDESKASRWLSISNADLEDRTPLEAVQEEGYRADLLEPIFTRIEHGIYA